MDVFFVRRNFTYVNSRMSTCSKIHSELYSIYLSHKMKPTAPRFKCVYCTKGTKLLSGIKHHLVNDHPELEALYSCPTCEQVCKSTFKLLSHILVTNECRRASYKQISNFACSQCTKSFPRKEHRQRHIANVHSGPYVCGKCKKSFECKYSCPAFCSFICRQ